MSTQSETLSALGVATLHEANGRAGLLSGVALLSGGAFAGPAVTVAIPAGDNLGVHLALEHAPGGSVLCAGGGGHGHYGVVGDLLVEAAHAAGLAAFVLDDGVRDIGTLAGPPSVAARCVCARGTIKHHAISVGEPVAVGRTLVAPGDWVIGDADGVCVIASGRIEDVVHRAQERMGKEDGLRAQLRSGVSTIEALGLRR